MLDSPPTQLHKLISHSFPTKIITPIWIYAIYSRGVISASLFGPISSSLQPFKPNPI